MDDKNMEQDGNAANDEADGGADQSPGGDQPVDSKWFMPGWPGPDDNRGDESGEQQGQAEPETSEAAEESGQAEAAEQTLQDEPHAEEPEQAEAAEQTQQEEPQAEEPEQAEAAEQTPQEERRAEEAAEVEDKPAEESDKFEWRPALNQGAWSYSGLVEREQTDQADEEPPAAEPEEQLQESALVDESATDGQDSEAAPEPAAVEEPVEPMQEPVEPVQEPAEPVQEPVEPVHSAEPVRRVEPQWVEPTVTKPRETVKATAAGGPDNLGPGGPGDDSESMGKPKKNTLKIAMMLIGGLALVAAVVCGIIFIVVPKAKEIDRTSNEAIAIYIALGVVVAGIISWLLLRKTLRTRLYMQKIVREDPDINDWLIVYNWTPKILYIPTIVAAFVASILMYLEQSNVWVFSRLDPSALGGIWFAIFFLVYLVGEYSISIKILVLSTVALGCFMLWLNLLGGVIWFLKLFTNLAVSISATGFLLIGVFGLLSILISWIKGMFYYVTMTPNYMNIQEGPTESGEQIGREDYNSRIDTNDFVERVMGFGRIIITFKDQKRQPISLLVWRIGRKSSLLERVRGKIAIDRPGDRAFQQQ